MDAEHLHRGDQFYATNPKGGRSICYVIRAAKNEHKCSREDCIDLIEIGEVYADARYGEKVKLHRRCAIIDGW